MKRISTKIILRAYHEAGHAVIDVATGRKVRRLTIVPDRECDGACCLEDEGMELAPIEFAAGVFAGGVAEEFAARKLHLDLPEDYELLTWGDDHAISQLPWDQDCREEQLEQALDRARALIDTHWAYVHALAQRLIEKRTLRGEEVHSILRGIR